MILKEPNCAKCPLSKGGKMPPNAVQGKGPLYDPDLVIIGEGPGREEEVHGEPFVGRSGKLLDEGIRLAGGDRSRMRIGNATLCRPPMGSSVGMRLEAAECCWPRLESELNCSEAPIIAYGRVAAEAIRHEPCNVVQDNGTAFKWNDRHVIMSLHPAYILRQIGVTKHPDGLLWALSAHIRNALDLAQGVPFIEVKDEDVQVFLEPGEEAAEALTELYQEAKEEFGFFAVDTEAHSRLPKPYLAKHPIAATIDMIGFATPRRAIAVAYPSAVLQPLLDQVFLDPDLGLVFHNLPYDLTSLRRHGFALRGKLGCTLLEHHAIFPGAKHALQQAATYWSVVSSWKSEYRNQKDTPQDRGIYCAKDTLTTARMHRRQQPLLDELGLREMHENDLFNARLASRMTLVGMPVDREENERLREIFQKKIDEHRGRVEARLEGFGDDLWRYVASEQALERRKKDPPEYRDRVELRFAELQKAKAKGKLRWKHKSATHLGAYCYMVGQPITTRTETGRLSTADEVLRELGAKCPEIMSLRILLDNAQLKATFLDNVFDREIYEGGKVKIKGGWAINGRVHPVWSVNKLPGRWGSSMNMVMNIPKGDLRRGRPNLRSQYKSLPGRVQVSFDYSSLHPRIIAVLSGDSFLRSIFREKKDIHSEIAAGIWSEFKTMKCPEPCATCAAAFAVREENRACLAKVRCQPRCKHCTKVEGPMCVRKKRMRDSVKAPEYTFFYRGTEHTAWLQACEETPGLPIENIRRMFAGMKRSMPGVWAWQERLLRSAAQRPFEVRDAAGWRRLTFHLGEPTPSDVVNFPVLATETLLMHRGLRKIAPKLKDYKDCEPIHYGSDAFTWEVSEDEADRLMVDVREAFEIEERGIPFPIDIAKGQSYADT